jgi:N utilization substance protein A
MDKILDIVDSIAYEKGLKVLDVEIALKESLIKTAQKMIDETLIYDASIDRNTKTLNLFQKIEVVSSDDIRLTLEFTTEVNTKGEEYEKINNKENFIILEEAKELDQDLQIGDFLNYDLEFESMGRNAASILFQNLEYRLQRHVEDNLFMKYNSKVGQTINAVITSVDSQENSFMEIGEVRAILPRKNRIKGEVFKVGDSIKAVVRAVRVDKKHGLIVEVSRTSPKFLEALLALEVPELNDEKITIEASARIPGARAKIAISTIETNMDPIGAIVGVKGVRINAVSTQLNNENIDCIEFSPIPEIFIARSLSPAVVNSVKIEASVDEESKPKAIVTINADQKGRAIGKVGLNIRLASMLTQHELELNIIEGASTSEDATSNEDLAPKKDVSELEALFK